MNIKESLKKITDKEDLNFEEMQEVSLDIMSGKVREKDGCAGERVAESY